MSVQFDEEVINSLRQRLRCNRSEAEVAYVLAFAPLISVPDLACLLERQERAVRHDLEELENRGLVRHHDLGCTARKTKRSFFTGYGLASARAAKPFWNEDWAIAELLKRPQLPEQFYRAAADQKPLGPLVEFSWFRNAPWKASARYTEGWVLFFWSGLLETEHSIRQLFRSLPEAAGRYASGRLAFPSLLIFIVHDPWQRELVLRPVRGLGMTDQVQVRSVRDGSVEGAREGSPRDGRLLTRPEGGEVGAWTLDARLRASMWAGDSGQLKSGLIDCALEWPGATASLAKSHQPAVGDIARVQQELNKLAEKKFLKKIKLDGRTNGFVIETKGHDFAATRDEVFSGIIPNRARCIEGGRPPTVRRHELGLRSLIAEFYDAELAAAAGDRSWEHLGGRGGIEPDAIVRLNDGPFGPGWHYVEYELRARGRRRAAAKLRSYASFMRQDNCPLMCVLRDERVEAAFQEVGLEAGIALLTTTVKRLREVGALACWSMYGKPVQIS